MVIGLRAQGSGGLRFKEVRGLRAAVQGDPRAQGSGSHLPGSRINPVSDLIIFQSSVSTLYPT